MYTVLCAILLVRSDEIYLRPTKTEIAYVSATPINAVTELLTYGQKKAIANATATQPNDGIRPKTDNINI